MVRFVTTVIKNDVERAKLFVNSVKKIRIRLATDPDEYLPVSYFVILAGLVYIDTDDS